MIKAKKTTDHAVVIAGGGPTGLMLAAELALAGVDAAIVERRPSQELIGLRAGGLHSRTIEVLDQRGIAGRFLSQGQTLRVAGFHMFQLDMSDFPTRHNYILHLWQNHIERILAEWVSELAVTIHRSREVTGFAQDDTGVDIALSDGQSLRAKYLIGCDGGRSLIRKSAGIDFPGWDATTSWLIAEVETTQEPKWGLHSDALGVHGIGKMENGKSARIVLTESQLQLDSEPSLRDVSEALITVYGTDYGIHSPTWISRFTDVSRQAAAYRDRRVLLAGDAAHVHPPMGGQGLNIGVQDAVNLGWKLAQVVNQTSPENLLDTYHVERHPVAARVLRNTMAQVALRRTDDRSKALSDTVSRTPRHGRASPAIGWRVVWSPCSLRSRRGTSAPRTPHAGSRPRHHQWRATRLHAAAPCEAGAPQSGRARRIRLAPWSDRVQLVDAKCDGCLGTPRTRPGNCTHRGLDRAQRMRGLGRETNTNQD